MNQPRGWWFESGEEQCDLKELVTITRVLLLYANVFAIAGYNFIDFVPANYKKKGLAGIIGGAFSHVSNTTYMYNQKTCVVDLCKVILVIWIN